MTQTLRDEFLSEEDLDLRTMSQEELLACWDQWLLQAQTTNAMTGAPTRMASS
jgi:hypothetical protein